MTFALQNVVIAAEVGAKEKETSVTKDTRIVEGAFRRVKQACASIKIGKTLQIVKQSGWATFNDVLDTFAVASDGSDFILSGTVVSDNTEMGVPFVPIFVGSSLHLPMLVALTIADGEVRFRVQISVKRDEKPQPIYEPTANNLNDATIYIGGLFSSNEWPKSRAKMISCNTDIYPVHDLLTPEHEDKPEAQSSDETSKSAAKPAAPSAVR